MQPALLALACALSLLVGSPAQARDLYLTPDGAGKQDGSSWSDAFAGKSLSSAVNDRLQPGDHLFIGGGIYRDAELNITKGGAPGQLKTITGVDRGQGLPVFTSNWSVNDPTRGKIAIEFGPGVTHVVLGGLRLKGYQVGVNARATKGKPARSHLVFNDVDMEHLRHGFYLSDCDDLQLTDCDLKRYSKHGFRFDQGCDRVRLTRCTADCSEGDAEWEKQTELFPFGFTVNDGGAPNTAFVFTDCLARNNLMPLQTNKYKNGDGFVVEGNTTDVQFIRCRALRNQDGGFDLKVRDVRLTDCVSSGNSRAYRIWSTGTLENCFAGWGNSGLWNNGGPVTATRCTFHALKGAAILTDDSATQPTTLKDCLISDSPKPQGQTAQGKIILTDTVIAAPANPARDPRYERPDSAWDGLGSAMDSRTYPNQGYHHPRGK